MNVPPGQPEPQPPASRPAGLVITISGPDPDGLRDLRSWLTQEDELHGRVALLEGRPPPGTLGAALEALSVSIGSGGAVSVIVAGVMSWVRQRYGQRRPASTAVIKLRCTNGASVEIPADILGVRSPAEINAQIRQLAEILNAGQTPHADDG